MKRVILIEHLMLLTAFAADPPAALYEEEPVATLALREKLWRQMDGFAQTLGQHQETRRHLLKTKLGYPPVGLHATAGKPRLEKIGEDAIATYYRCWIEVAPGMDQYGLYLVPHGAKGSAKGKTPLVISLHGGGGTPEMALFKGGTNYHDMVRGAAREGYLVWAPLTVMYPYRDRDKQTAIPAEVRRDLDAPLRAAGSSLMGLEVAKISLALDSLIAHRREIDARRIAAVGLSYGGFYTLYLSALNPKIKAAVASCSFRNEAGAKGPEEGRPVDMAGPELASLVAPRALQVQAGVNDKGFPIDDVRKAAGRAQAFYGDAKTFEFQEFDGGHEWRGTLAWPFLKQHLR